MREFNPSPTIPGLSPYMQELIRRYGYSPPAQGVVRRGEEINRGYLQLDPYMRSLMGGDPQPVSRPYVPPPPDDFTRPIIYEMPAEVPLTPYMRELILNYQTR